MIYSMTGYGGAKGEAAGLSISVELKSVNNRFLDTSVRLPRNYLFAEEGIKSAVGAHISRGKVDVFVTLDGSGADTLDVVVNKPLVKSYLEALRTISEELDVPLSVDALSISRFSDVLSVEKKEADTSVIGEGILSVLEQALAEYDAMRQREGAKLAEDIENRLETVERLVSEVEERSPQTVEEYRNKLTAKITEVLESKTVDEQRILTEAAIFADKIAVDEETVRLRSHISQLREMLKVGSPIGRKMDFLIQEFNREANTIGSKCSDADIAKKVVDLKSEIEKIREQIQNIE
jgi:uncharacterized protein (TIGR00255 family)